MVKKEYIQLQGETDMINNVSRRLFIKVRQRPSTVFSLIPHSVLGANNGTHYSCAFYSFKSVDLPRARHSTFYDSWISFPSLIKTCLIQSPTDDHSSPVGD